ncbi:ABC transporter ATP-binding protein [Limoniibacter endophyticus]|uniref:Iron ABC transporter ATP-binding protein n=1 Tax=Limoniibacter endophyticus TaxID=1565040 RepID=A0A8J3GID8_9HYPH|nr:ABC transporter ATP-binding protein [Limoniibacter endophyticus]GHC77894.1 iron ABC transporter ATP-binding protein [Limoniibacter endophyticus]
MTQKLELHGIAKNFNRKQALRDVTLSIAAGEIVSLVGQSGCGKSTLLRLIAGIEHPDGGRIFLDGAEVSGRDRFVEPENRKVGMVFQDYALFPHLTVRQNIRFGMKGRLSPADHKRISGLMASLGLEKLAENHPHMLSGGEQQRVALARALAPQPSVLLMDEPFSNLDRGLRDRVRTETVALLRDLGTTVIIVTHDAEEALSSGDTVVLMREGGIVQAGSPYEIYDHPISPYAARFFCDFNVLPGRLRSGGLETALGCFAAPNAKGVEGGPGFAYIRPQQFLPSLQGGKWRGKITGRTFLGADEVIEIRVPQLADPVRLRTSQRIPRDIVELGFDMADQRVIVFDDKKGDVLAKLSAVET